eukprot:scaffold2220_cov377-Prasinococcus_capsulatus_cf.AAC.6
MRRPWGAALSKNGANVQCTSRQGNSYLNQRVLELFLSSRARRCTRWGSQLCPTLKKLWTAAPAGPRRSCIPQAAPTARPAVRGAPLSRSYDPA